MKELLSKNLVSNAKESTTFSMTQGQILKAHVGLATRSAASISLWESLQSKLVDSKGDYKMVAY